MTARVQFAAPDTGGAPSWRLTNSAPQPVRRRGTESRNPLSGEELREVGFDRGLGLGTNHCLNDLAAPEHLHRRD